MRPSERNDIERRGCGGRVSPKRGDLQRLGCRGRWGGEDVVFETEKYHHALVLLVCNIEIIYYSPKTHLLHSRRGSNRRSCRTSVKEEVEANPLSISARGLTLLNRRVGKVVPS